MLRSLNPVAKKSAAMARELGRSSPDPGLGTRVELGGGHTGGLFDLIGIGKTLTRERITTEEAPPAFLQIEPAGAFGNKDVLEAWVVCKPSACFQTVVTAQIVRDDEKVTRGIVSFNPLEQFNVYSGR